MKRIQRKGQNSKGKGRQPGATTVTPPPDLEQQSESDMLSSLGVSGNATVDVRTDSSTPQTLVESTVNEPSTSLSSSQTGIPVTEIGTEVNESNQDMTSENSSSNVTNPQDNPTSTTQQEPQASSKPKIVAEFFFNMKLTPENRHPNADLLHVFLIPKGDEKKLKLPKNQRILHTVDIKLDPNYKPCHNFKRIPFPTFPTDDSTTSQQSTSQCTLTAQSSQQSRRSGVRGLLASSLSRPASTSQSNVRRTYGNISRAVRNRNILTSEGVSEHGINQDLPSTSTSHRILKQKKKCYHPNSLPNSTHKSQESPLLGNRTINTMEASPMPGRSDTSEVSSPPSLDRVSVNILYKKKNPESRFSLLKAIVNKPKLRNQTVVNLDTSPLQDIVDNTELTPSSDSSRSVVCLNKSKNSECQDSMSSNVGNEVFEPLSRNEPMTNAYASPTQGNSSTSEVNSPSVSSESIVMKKQSESCHSSSGNPEIEPKSQTIANVDTSLQLTSPQAASAKNKKRKSKCLPTNIDKSSPESSSTNQASSLLGSSSHFSSEVTISPDNSRAKKGKKLILKKTTKLGKKK